MTAENHNQVPDREWLLKMADAEDACRSVSVGGMAADLLGAQATRTTDDAQRVFGRFIGYARRAKGWTVEQLAMRADVEVAEIVDIERHELAVPQPRTVYQLANVLGLPPKQLVEVAGLATPRREVDVAALRFAARSEPTAKLTPAEREAFEEFVKVLVEISDGGQILAEQVFK